MSIARFTEDGREQLLQDHLFSVANLAKRYAEKIGLGSFGEVSGLLHDYGKYDLRFQRYLNSASGKYKYCDADYLDPVANKGKIDHSTPGALYLKNVNGLHQNIKEILTLITALHHGGLIDFISPDGTMPLSKRLEKSMSTDGFQKAEKDKFDFELSRRVNVEKLQQEYKEYIKKFKNIENNNIRLFLMGLTIKFLYSCLIDADRTDSTAFEDSDKYSILYDNQPNWEQMIQALEKHLARFKVRNDIDLYRRKISDQCQEKAGLPGGIFRLNVPTGGGKTLASLRFALEHAKKNNLDHIFYIIPYTSIIDQNAEDVRAIFKEYGLEDLVLEHHSNLTDEKNTEINNILMDNWNAPIVFTTMVQFLEALFAGGTRSPRRFHQLGKSVIIFDEIQTIGIKNIFMYNAAIQYLTEFAGSSVVLCTATQPVLDNEILAPHQLKISEHNDISAGIPEMDQVFERVKTIDKSGILNWSHSDTVEIIMNEFKNGNSVLTITNTKNAAKELVELISSKLTMPYHLSTSMCARHRKEILKKIREDLVKHQKKEGPPVICVSTQLIEAGVDVDFDAVIRHLAGVDSIVQAAGRCNRSGLREELGRLYVVDPIEEKITKLEDIRRGREVTKRVFSDFYEQNPNKDLQIINPIVIQNYFTQYYFNRKSQMDYPVFLGKYEVSDNLFRLLSSNEISRCQANRINSTSAPYFAYAFQTAANEFKAIDALTQGVIVPYLEGKEIINRLCASKNPYEISALLKEAQQYSINLFDYQIKELFKNQYLHETQIKSGIFYLSEEGYDDTYGLYLNDHPENVYIF